MMLMMRKKVQVKAMRKVFSVIKAFFHLIYVGLDKIIIMPISKLVYRINKRLKGSNNKLDKILNKPLTLIYLSLIFAVGIFFLVDSKVISLVQTEAEVLADQEVVAEYNKEAYVVEGIPDDVDVTLIGRKSDLYLAKQLGDHEVKLDLTKYGVGEHRVRLTYNQSIGSLNYKLDPSTVLVVIKEKISTLKTISYDLLNEDKLDEKLNVESVTLDRNEVVVKGAEDTLAKVATVRALIDLSNDEFDEKGDYTIDNVPLVAYDNKGKIVKNVEIVPEKTTATIKLESYSTEVPLKIMTTGNPKSGKAISEIKSSVEKVTIYGDQKTLQNITEVPVTIDVKGLSSEKTYNVTISKPSGVRHMSDTTATITVKFGEESQKTIDGISVEWQNLSSSYSVNAKSAADAQISVIAKGTKEVLDALDPSTIKAYVDLSGYGEGEHQVTVTVEGTDPKIQFLSNKQITIIVSAK